MEPIILTAHQYEDALRDLPSPLNHRFRELGLDVLINVPEEVVFTSTQDSYRNTDFRPTLKNLTTLRFRLNHTDRQIPFWEPTEDILIKSSKK